MTDNELIAALRLHRIPKIGDITAKKLIRHCGSPTAVFSDKMSHLLKVGRIGSVTLEGLHDIEHLEAAEAELAYMRRAGIEVSYFEETYPDYLKQCSDAPIILFKKGNIDLVEQKIISIVGTRDATAYGRQFCEQLIDALSPLDPVIVSGYAYGIDICAHRAAMANGLQTIACLAHGLNQTYPKPHQRYTAEVMRNGGFLTEFWSDSHPNRENFLQRNRIIAGISEATVVIQSGEKGGSLVTASLANSYDREVMAVPGRTTDLMSLGCNNLIKQQKAHCITTAADLVYLLNWDLSPPPKQGVQMALFSELNQDEKAIYSYLKQGGRQLVDTIALKCQLPVFKATSSLTSMEMKGAVRPLPGKLFEAI